MVSPGINILLIDNYDSFTYNIAHCVKTFPGANLQIIEAGDLEKTDIGSYEKIIFSPGPDLPRPGNTMEKILREYSECRSIIGICLGLQAIYLFYGGRIRQLDEVVHGRKKLIRRTACHSKMLKNMPETFEAGLYHSWVADPEYLPDELEVTALTVEGRIMGIRHTVHDIEAVQFHPESIMTDNGARMITDWIGA